MANIIALMRDSLTSLVSRMGTERDKAATTFYVAPVLTDEQIAAAYRGSWLPRKIVDIPALDACRKWRNWQAKADQIERIEAEETRLCVRARVLDAVRKARLWGGASLLIGTGDTDPASPLDPERIGTGGVRYLTVLTRRQIGSGETDTDPASEWYGQPAYYTMSGQAGGQVRIHPSRLVRFTGAMPPDDDIGMAMLGGWGESVLTAALDAMRHADGTAGNIASLVFEAKIDIIRVPDFMANVGDAGYRQKILERYSLANAGKGINGTLILDKDEEYETKAAPLSGLTDILMAFLQVVSGAADIPVTRLLGQSPAGLNSTGESDLANYHDRIQAMQELEIGPAMARLDECLIRSALGGRDPAIYYAWAPLKQMSEREKADILKTKAEAARTLAGSGAGQEIIPLDALSDALVNALVEDGSLPGLEAAIATHGALVEQEPDDDEVQAAAGQTDPGPGPRQPVGDARPRTLYVSRPERFEELDEDWSAGIAEDAEGGGREAGRPFEDGKRRKRGGGAGNGRFNPADHPRGPDGRWIGGRTADPRALKRFANQVQKSSQKRPPFEWGTVRDGRRVEAAVGVDTTGFSRSFDFDGVRHVLNRHGRLSGDRHKITPSEFRLVPRVLEHGMIVKAIHATKKHAQRVTYELSIRGRKYRVVEEIRRHKRAAVLKTFFVADD